MAFTADDVVEWLIDEAAVAAGTIDADLLARVVAAVNAHAARHYDLTDAGDGTDTERDQALIMECGRLYSRRHTQNGYAGAGDYGPVRVLTFDADVQRLLAGRMLTAGMFGPTEDPAT